MINCQQYSISVGKFFMPYLKSSWLATANFNELNLAHKDTVYRLLS